MSKMSLLELNAVKMEVNAAIENRTSIPYMVLKQMNELNKLIDEYNECKKREEGYMLFSSDTGSISSSSTDDTNSDSDSSIPKSAPKSLAAMPMDRKRSYPTGFKWVSPVPRKKNCICFEGRNCFAVSEAKSKFNIRTGQYEWPGTRKQPESPKDVLNFNSMQEGGRILKWLLDPVDGQDFFSYFFEKEPCLVLHESPKYFSKLISFKMIDELLIKNHLKFTTNVDVTKYQSDKFMTLNPKGCAKPPIVWRFYGDGCTIRILNSCTYLPGLHNMCSMLQEFFQSSVGATVYLTPPDSQGFAPRSDGFETFVMQIEGRQRWRLYLPLQPGNVISRESSDNYRQEQLGVPTMDKVLQAGDFLYLPRGTIHQAITDKDQHSLHITLSVNKQPTWADLLEQLMPLVLQMAVKQHHMMRYGLPFHIWKNLGVMHGYSYNRRIGFIEKIQNMVKYLVPSFTEIDSAVDKLAKKFQHEALPPTILPEEKVRTIFGSRIVHDRKGHLSTCDYKLTDYKLTDYTSIRLLRANILRIVRSEEDCSLRIYYYLDNDLDNPGKDEANFMDVETGELLALEVLFNAYPKYIRILMLALKTAEERIKLATALFERGLVMTKQPFK